MNRCGVKCAHLVNNYTFYDSISNKSRNLEMFTHSDFKEVLSLVIVIGIAATASKKLDKKIRTSEFFPENRKANSLKLV